MVKGKPEASIVLRKASLTLMLIILCAGAAAGSGPSSVSPPEWKVGYTWHFLQDNRRADTEDTAYGKVTIERSVVDTVYRIQDPYITTWEGEEVYAVNVTQRSHSLGHWSLMGFSGVFEEKSLMIGYDYYRVSDMAKVGAEYYGSGTIGLGDLVEEQSFESKTRMVFDPPEEYLSFPLFLGKSWNVSSKVIVDMYLTYSDISPTTEHVEEDEVYTATVVGMEDVTTDAGTFENCYVIDRGDKGIRYYSPTVGMVVKDTENLLELVSFSKTTPQVKLEFDETVAQARPGENDTVSLRLENEGDEAVYDVNLSVSLDGNHTATIVVPALNAHEEETVDVPVTLPPGKINGSMLSVKVESYRNASGTIRPYLAVSLIVMPEHVGADISVFYAEVEGTPRMGFPAVVDVKIRNVGSQPIQGPVNVYLVENQTVVDSVVYGEDIPPLSVSPYLRLNWTPKLSGNLSLEVLAEAPQSTDPDGVFPFVVGNNRREISVFVPPQDYAFFLEGDNKGEVERNESLSLSFSIRNIGLRADNITAAVMSAPAEWGTGNSSNQSLALAPGEEGEVTFVLTPPPGAPLGEYQVNLGFLSSGDPSMRVNRTVPVTLYPRSSLEVSVNDTFLFRLESPEDYLPVPFSVANTGESTETVYVEAYLGGGAANYSFFMQMVSSAHLEGMPVLSPGEEISFYILIGAKDMNSLPPPGQVLPLSIVAYTSRKSFENTTSVVVGGMHLIKAVPKPSAKIEGEVNILLDVSLFGNEDMNVTYGGVLVMDWDEGWTDTIPLEVEGPGTLSPGKTEEVQLRLSSESYIPPGNYMVYFTVKDPRGRIIVNTTIPYTFDERRVIEISAVFLGTKDGGQTRGGSEVMFTVNVSNEGNAPFCGNLQVILEDEEPLLIAVLEEGVCIEPREEKGFEEDFILPVGKPGVPFSLVFQMMNDSTPVANRTVMLPYVYVPPPEEKGMLPGFGVLSSVLVLCSLSFSVSVFGRRRV